MTECRQAYDVVEISVSDYDRTIFARSIGTFPTFAEAADEAAKLADMYAAEGYEVFLEPGLLTDGYEAIAVNERVIIKILPTKVREAE